MASQRFILRHARSMIVLEGALALVLVSLAMDQSPYFSVAHVGSSPLPAYCNTPAGCRMAVSAGQCRPLPNSYAGQPGDPACGPLPISPVVPTTGGSSLINRVVSGVRQFFSPMAPVPTTTTTTTTTTTAPTAGFGAAEATTTPPSTSSSSSSSSSTTTTSMPSTSSSSSDSSGGDSGGDGGDSGGGSSSSASPACLLPRTGPCDNADPAKKCCGSPPESCLTIYDPPECNCRPGGQSCTDSSGAKHREWCCDGYKCGSDGKCTTTCFKPIDGPITCANDNDCCMPLVCMGSPNRCQKASCADASASYSSVFKATGCVPKNMAQWSSQQSSLKAAALSAATSSCEALDPQCEQYCANGTLQAPVMTPLTNFPKVSSTGCSTNHVKGIWNGSCTRVRTCTPERG